MGKLFTAILNKRLKSFIESNNLLTENMWFPVRKLNVIIYSLYIIIKYLKGRKMKLFCAFIGFQKAFDSIWRTGLLTKLMNYNITGIFLLIIKNMYDNIKSCVSIDDNSTASFDCKTGLKQGEKSFTNIIFFIS